MFVYDPVGHLTAVTNALNQPVQFGYDPVGNLTNIIDARDNAVVFAYDPLNRLTNINYACQRRNLPIRCGGQRNQLYHPCQPDNPACLQCQQQAGSENLPSFRECHDLWLRCCRPVDQRCLGGRHDHQLGARLYLRCRGAFDQRNAADHHRSRP